MVCADPCSCAAHIRPSSVVGLPRSIALYPIYGMSTSVLMVTEVKMQKQVPQSAVSQAPQVLNGVVDSCKRRLRKWHRKFSRKKTKVVVQDEQTVHYYCPQYPVNHRYEGGLGRYLTQWVCCGKGCICAEAASLPCE